MCGYESGLGKMQADLQSMRNTYNLFTQARVKVIRKSMIKMSAAIIIVIGKVFIAKRKPTGRLSGMWEVEHGKSRAR